MTSSTTNVAPKISELQENLTPETVYAVKTFMSYLAKENLSGIVKVLLYGSRARGNFDADSDIDMAVVFEGPVQNSDERFALQMPLSKIRGIAMRETAMTVSAIALWEEELREPEKQKNPAFYHNVNQDGIDAETIMSLRCQLRQGVFRFRKKGIPFSL